MKYLLKDQIRKIKSHPFNFISLSILVFIIVFSYSLIQTSIDRLDLNHEEYLETQQLEDFYFSLGEMDISYLTEAQIYQVCKHFGTQVEIECATAYMQNTEESLNELNVLLTDLIKNDIDFQQSFVDNYLENFIAENDFTVEENYIVNIREKDYYYKFITVTNQINLPYLVEGTLPINNNEIAVFPDFLKENNLSLNDTLMINDQEFFITGTFYKPEFLFPIMSMDQIQFDSSKQTLVLCNEDTIHSLNQTVYTKYLVKGDTKILTEDFGYEDIQNSDFSFLGKNLELIEFLMPSSINFRIISLTMEIENAQSFTTLFLPIFIFFTTVLLLIFMKQYISNNQKDIDTLYALGYSKMEITLSILVYPFLISLQSIFGYILGIFISYKTFDLYSKRYLFPKSETIFFQNVFYLSVIIPILMITITSFIFIYRSIPLKTKQSRRKRTFFKYHPLKTILQTFILFLTVSIMITFSLNGTSMFHSFIDYTRTGNNYKLMIDLTSFKTDEFDETYQPYSKIRTEITSINNNPLTTVQASSLYGISPNNSLKLLIDDNIENNTLLNEGVIISSYLESTLSLKPGDVITYTIGQVNYEATVVGVSNELLENNIFMKQETLNDLYGVSNDSYNGLFTTDNSYNENDIKLTIDYNQSIQEFESILNMSSTIMLFLIFLSMIISIFIFILIMINYFKDNKIPIAILKSIGYNNYEINKKFTFLLYFLLLLSYFIAIPITIVLLNQLLEILINQIGFKLILEINIWNILIGFIVINLLFIAITFFSNKYYNSIQISDIIKHNIK
jgi:putative ABC transport system permease protein